MLAYTPNFLSSYFVKGCVQPLRLQKHEASVHWLQDQVKKIQDDS